MKVVLYARSSSGSEEVEHQLDSLRRSLPPGDTVLGSFGDVATGRAIARPGLEKALSPLAGREIDAIHVTSPDRLTRSQAELAEIETFLQGRGVAISVVEMNQQEG